MTKTLETILIVWVLAAIAAVVTNSALARESAADDEEATFIAVPKACDGVMEELDLPDDVRVEHYSTLEGLPHPEAIHAFMDSVEGLELALLPLDSLDQDTFYVRVYVLALDELEEKYPSMDTKLLVAAKKHACRQSLRGSERRHPWPARTGGDEPQPD